MTRPKRTGQTTYEAQSKWREKNNLRRIEVSLPEELVRRLDAQAEALGMTRTELVKRALTQSLRRD